MLIGIVFSLPLLAFTVYTVLTVYVDENGFVSPNSLFVKVGNNMNVQNGMSNPMHEEIVQEAQDVLQVKPDVILKVPDYVNSFLYNYQEQESSPTRSSQRVIQKLHVRGKRSTALSNLEDEINSEINSTNLETDRKSTNSEILEIDFISNERNNESDPKNKKLFETDLIDAINIDFVPNLEEPEKNDERNITSSESTSTSPKIKKVKIKIGPRTITDSGIINFDIDPTFVEIGKKIANADENSAKSEGETGSSIIHMIDPESPRRRKKRDITDLTPSPTTDENITTANLTKPIPLSPPTTNNTTVPSSPPNNVPESQPPPPPPPAPPTPPPPPPPTPPPPPPPVFFFFFFFPIRVENLDVFLKVFLNLFLPFERSSVVFFVFPVEVEGCF
uniref:Uncharacterized protein n=1 Tax=Cacopsylla melanoneura TaxID=428564 RepID=A0A8D8UEE3_9HEMI